MHVGIERFHCITVSGDYDGPDHHDGCLEGVCVHHGGQSTYKQTDHSYSRDDNHQHRVKRSSLLIV